MKRFPFLVLLALTCTILLFHVVSLSTHVRNPTFIAAAAPDNLTSKTPVAADKYTGKTSLGESDNLDDLQESRSNHATRELLDPREKFHFSPQIANWDLQREKWLQKYPHKRLTPQGRPQTILVTSSPSGPCEYPTGDYFLLKSIKNKIDYCRLHTVEIYYNMAVMEMGGFWVKLPIVRRLMLQHPEAEWIWWMDSDAVFTDMDFEIPLDRYDGFNMVIPGWDDAVYKRREWTGLNAGIFLMRNCQWSLDFLDMWAALGEDYGDNKREMGEFVAKQLTGRGDFEIDDQAGLIWLLISRPELRSQVFLETSYCLHSYWVMVAPRFEEMLANFETGGERWPFITHFVGCKFCSGKYNSTPMETCDHEAKRAFNFADDQVLQPYGYKHASLSKHQVLPISHESIDPDEMVL